MTRPIVPADFAAPLLTSIQAPAFNHDGSLLAFLDGDAETGVLDLHVFDRRTRVQRIALSAADINAAPTTLFLEEELSHERERLRFSGVTNIKWCPQSDTLVTIVSNRLVLVNARTLERTVFTHESYIESVQMSSSGRELAFCSGCDLWSLAMPQPGQPAGAARRLTRDGSPTHLNGVADQITREEIFNGAPYCWLADDLLLYANFDTTAVESIYICNGAQIRAERLFYSRPGHAVATYTLYLCDLSSGERRQVLPACEEWPYLVGLERRTDDEIVLMRLRRDQTALQLLSLAPRDGAISVLVERTQRPWINVMGMPLFRKSDGSFFWIHEAAGVGRVGHFAANGTWLLDIGEGACHVESLIGTDENGEGIYFIATGPDARSRFIYYASPSSDWKSAQLTESQGTHTVIMTPDSAHWLHTHDAITLRPTTRIERIGGTIEHSLARVPERAFEASFVTPILVDGVAADGETLLHAAIYEPPQSAVEGNRPVVLLVYGGPHAQAVRNAWTLTAELRAQFLAQHGFVVVKVDNRGTSGRGHAFETPIYGQLGTQEVADQCAALEQILNEHTGLDRSRVGVCGWSYGGYMALRCMQLRRDLFRSGVAGAPVVSWQEYDAPYTERYMGVPHEMAAFESSNESGYVRSGVLSKVDALTAPVLLIHGMNDENVLFRHTALLIDAFAECGRAFELLVLPNERHGVRRAAQRAYLELRILEFLERTLR